jgi:hypothetical protein
VACAVAGVSAHMALTYPAARKYDLDFLDNSRTKGPCGMPKGESSIFFYQHCVFLNYKRRSRSTCGNFEVFDQLFAHSAFISNQERSFVFARGRKSDKSAR